MLEFILLVAVGLIVGIYDSVVGSGGLVILAALSLLRVPPLVAIGTMRLVTLVQETVSLGAFLRKGLVEVRTGLILGLVSAVGAIFGTTVVLGVQEDTLAVIAAILMLTLAIVLPFLQAKTGTYRPIYIIKKLYKNISKKDTLEIMNTTKMAILMILFFILGLYGGFYGAGFGTLSLIIFTYVGKTSLMVGAGNSRLVGFIMSLTAGILFINKGAISLYYFAPLTIGTIIGAWFGVELADRLGTKYIKIMLTAAVLIASTKILFDLVL